MTEVVLPHPQEQEQEEQPQEEEPFCEGLRVTVPVQPRPSVMVSTFAPLQSQSQEEPPQ